MTLIIVPFVDNAKVTIDCLKSVNATKTESDIVVAIANGSKDGTFDKVFNKFDNGDDFTVIRVKEHKCISDIWNRSFRMLNGDERICFLHNDTIVKDNWLTEMELGFDVIPDSCILSQQGNASRGARFTVVDDIDKINGYCFMLSHAVMNKVGKFDLRFVLKPHIDYFHRILDNDMKIVVANKSIVDHIGGVTTNRYSLSYYTEQVGKELILIRNR